MTHWTSHSSREFAYSVCLGFTAQLELEMQRTGITRAALAEKLNKTAGRVSQVFNDPGNLSVKTMVDYARGLGMKVGIIAYDDGDPDNARGPINPEVFVRSWEFAGCPEDLHEIEDAHNAASWNDFYVSSWTQKHPVSMQCVFAVPAPAYVTGTENSGITDVSRIGYGNGNITQEPPIAQNRRRSA